MMFCFANSARAAVHLSARGARFSVSRDFPETPHVATLYLLTKRTTRHRVAGFFTPDMLDRVAVVTSSCRRPRTERLGRIGCGTPIGRTLSTGGTRIHLVQATLGLASVATTGK